MDYMHNLNVIYILIMMLLLDEAVGSRFNPEVSEFCQLEDFRASCPEHQVIVVSYARYGRMHIGRCVPQDFGHIGCAADVLAELDRRCSGRQSCRFKVADLHGSNQCPDGLTPYLEVSHDCVDVFRPDRGVPCELGRPVLVTSSSGHIASVLTERTEYGSENCPWLLKALPGQRINMTLQNFARVPVESTGGVTSSDDLGPAGIPPHVPRPRVCYQLAVIKEVGSQSRTITECEGGPRESHVVVSKTDTVELTVLNRVASDVYFLIHYEYIGCVNPEPPTGAQSRRMGRTLEVRCNYTDQTWQLICENNQWHGEVGNCTKLIDDTNEVMFGQPGEFPYGILLVVSIGVALGVFFGGILLTIASMYMKRRRLQRERSPETPTDERVYNFSPDGQNTKNVIISQTLPYSTQHQHPQHMTPQCMTLTRTTDPRLKDITLVEPTYHQYGMPEGQTTLAFTPRTLGGHIYESPQFEHKPS